MPTTNDIFPAIFMLACILLLAVYAPPAIAIVFGSMFTVGFLGVYVLSKAPRVPPPWDKPGRNGRRTRPRK